MKAMDPHMEGSDPHVWGLEDLENGWDRVGLQMKRLGEDTGRITLDITDDIKANCCLWT